MHLPYDGRSFHGIPMVVNLPFLPGSPRLPGGPHFLRPTCPWPRVGSAPHQGHALWKIIPADYRLVCCVVANRQARPGFRHGTFRWAFARASPASCPASRLPPVPGTSPSRRHHALNARPRPQAEALAALLRPRPRPAALCRQASFPRRNPRRPP